MQTNSFLTVMFSIITSFYDMLRRSARFACMILVALAAMVISSAASAQQTVVRYVNIDRPWQQFDIEDGLSWTDAFRFLQDAIANAEQWLALNPDDTVEIWVAEGTYRPDQNLNNDDPDHPDPQKRCDPEFDANGPSSGGCPQLCSPPYGNGLCSAVFEIGSNIHLLGGFPPNPHDEGTYGTGGAKEEHRQPDVHETVLSGDLAVNMMGLDHTVTPAQEVGFTRRDNVIIDYPKGCVELTFENYFDNSRIVVSIEDAMNAELDGFTVRGSVRVSGAGACLRDCIFMVSEGPALWCSRGSQVEVWRSRTAAGECLAERVAIEEGARVYIIPDCVTNARKIAPGPATGNAAERQRSGEAPSSAAPL